MKTPSTPSQTQKKSRIIFMIRRNAKSITLAVPVLAALSPVLAFAQVSSFKSLVQIVIGLIQSLIPLVVALTLLVFIWGIFQLVRSNSDDSRAEAIAVITYGIVSLFVMVSVWGLVSILTSTFFGGALIIPQLR